MDKLSQGGLRLAFAGTPEFSANIFKTLLQEPKHQVTMVLTQPDRPYGRGRKMAASAVKKLALANDITVLQPNKSELITLQEKLSKIDLMIVAAFGMILPEAILNAPTYGCINIHTSLLPKWRGAAPIQRAIQAGDRETGISIIQMDSGLDTGPILLQKNCPINDSDTSDDLHIKLSSIGSECLLKVLEQITSDRLQATNQDNSKATYANKISKSEAEIDWTLPAIKIDCAIRAFNPAPVCYTKLADMQLRIWQAEVLDKDLISTPGKILSLSPAGIDVATGQGVLRILTLQPQGKRAMPVADFLNGHPGFGGNN